MESWIDRSPFVPPQKHVSDMLRVRAQIAVQFVTEFDRCGCIERREVIKDVC